VITVELRRRSGVPDDLTMNSDLADKLERELRRYTPVRTGRLRRGWEIVRVNSRSIVIENSVYYGYWVNEGNTNGLAPRRFTQRAVQAFERRYSKLLVDYRDARMQFIEP